jgi:hypothetical protein
MDVNGVGSLFWVACLTRDACLSGDSTRIGQKLVGDMPPGGHTGCILILQCEQEYLSKEKKSSSKVIDKSQNRNTLKTSVPVGYG